jgi:hypothetical protein
VHRLNPLIKVNQSVLPRAIFACQNWRDPTAILLSGNFVFPKERRDATFCQVKPDMPQKLAIIFPTGEKSFSTVEGGNLRC